MGQFLYYRHPSTCEIWTHVRHLLVHISHFRDNLVLFFGAIKFGGAKNNVYFFFILEKNTHYLIPPPS